MSERLYANFGLRFLAFFVSRHHIFHGIATSFAEFLYLCTHNILKRKTMARPIKETPILYGEDTRRFEARMKERRRISPEERAEMNSIYNTIMATANF